MCRFVGESLHSCRRRRRRLSPGWLHNRLINSFAPIQVNAWILELGESPFIPFRESAPVDFKTDCPFVTKSLP
jgi:hypothetical protein